jgi:hypothetical protein
MQIAAGKEARRRVNGERDSYKLTQPIVKLRSRLVTGAVHSATSRRSLP